MIRTDQRLVTLTIQPREGITRDSVSAHVNGVAVLRTAVARQNIVQSFLRWSRLPD